MSITSFTLITAAVAEEVQLIDKAVLIYCNDGQGTGFYTSEKKIVTAEHVVADCTDVTIENNNGDISRARVSFSNKVRDVAVLNADEAIAPVSTLNTSTVLPNDVVQIVGAPIAGLVLSSGKVSEVFNQEDQYNLLLDIPGDFGNSGGPVFKDGEVIGLVNAKNNSGYIYGMNATEIETALKDDLEKKKQNVVTLIINNEGPLAFSILLNVILLILSLVLILNRKKTNQNQIVIKI